MDPVRPALKEPVMTYAAAYIAVLAFVSSTSWLGLPAALSLSFLMLVFVVAGILFGWLILLSVFLHFTELYVVEGGQVLVRRGLLIRTGSAIRARNIAEVQAIRPFPLRFLGVGAVRIGTNDGMTHLLYNVRGPEAFAESVSALLPR